MSPSTCRIRHAHRLLLLLVLWAAALPAQAAISCTASMTPLNFGAVSPFASLTNNTATLTYTCTNSDKKNTYSALLCFSIGEPGGGPTNPRLMSSGANTLQFQLYQDAARTLVWGSQMFGTFRTPLAVPITIKEKSNGSGSATLYGQVLGGQNTAVPANNYRDNYQNGDTALTINEQVGNTAPNTCSDTSVGTFFPFLVSAAVSKQCLVTATSDLDLGTVPASATNVSANGNVSIACSNTTPYYVGLLPSNGNSAGAGLMSASGGITDQVPYQLYQNSGMSTIWGNTASASGAGNGVAGTGNGSAKPHTVYVKAPSADYQPGSYSDTVVVNVNY